MDKTFYGFTLKAFGSLVLNMPKKINKTTNSIKIRNLFLLNLRSSEKTSLAHAAGFDSPQVELFFKKLRDTMNLNTKEFKISSLYNMDESGILTVPNKLPKVVAPKGKSTVGI